MRPLTAGIVATTVAWCALFAMPTDGFARPQPKPGKLMIKFSARKQKLLLRWEGRIMHPMAREFGRAIDRWLPRARNGIVVNLNSGGGKVREMKRVIRILREVRETHRIDTLVRNGQRCGSSCVPIFLQGERRKAGHASAWLFHEITNNRVGDDGRRYKIARPRRTDKFYRDFFQSAGVPQRWINRIRNKIEGADYWMTGSELFTSGSQIATHLLSNHKRRRLRNYRPRRFGRD